MYMTGFCALFTIAFGLSVGTEKMRQLITTYFEDVATGESLTFIIAAVVFVFVYHVVSQTIRDSNDARKKHLNVVTKNDKPIVYMAGDIK